MAEPLRFLAVCLRKEFKRQTFVPHIKWEMVVFERDYQAIQKKLLTTWSLVRIQLPGAIFYPQNRKTAAFLRPLRFDPGKRFFMKQHTNSLRYRTD